ncbi:unnamed protein product [Durusdinium trenchii]|uniref:Uncharacterized protein n=2 Tax=Durusdinium trenchii TaxID=1381693 RepID=A0ABP0KGR5_9DINO
MALASGRDFRIALLIGNQTYEDEESFGKIKYCYNDVNVVETTLKTTCGFQHVIKYYDAKKSDFDTLRTQLARCIQSADREFVLVYYAGHAVTIAGQGYFIPVDAKGGEVRTYLNIYKFLQPLHDLISERSLHCSRLAAKEMSAYPAPGALGCLILDGCRTREQVADPNELNQDEFVQKLSAGGKLYPADSQLCMLFDMLLACDEGAEAAEDLETEHGFLTEAFLHCIQTPGKTLPELFDLIRARCTERRRGKQRPWLHSSSNSASLMVLHQMTHTKPAPVCPRLPAIEHMSCPESAAVFLKTIVDNFQATINRESLKEDGINASIEQVRAVLMHLLRLQDKLKEQTLMNDVIHSLRGLQDLLPKHRALATLVTEARSRVWLEAARSRFEQTALRSDVEQWIQANAELLNHISVTVAFVGPTSAGKSTLVNSYFGQIVCPMGAAPTSLLPIVFTANGAHANGFQVIPRGTGLTERLALQGQKENLTAHEALGMIAECSSFLRQLILDGQLRLKTEPGFKSWHMEVLVPGPAKCFSIVDCPGGSEGEEIGKAVNSLLQHQAQEACLSVLVVKSDGLAPLSHHVQTCAFFGGSIPGKDVFLVATHVDKQNTRDDTEKWLKTNFTCLGTALKRMFFLDCKIALAYQICDARDWQVLPEHSSEEFKQGSEEIELCVGAVSPSVDVSVPVEYEPERKEVWNKLQRAHRRSCLHNTVFKDELEGHVVKTWPDLFVNKIRNLLLDDLAEPLARLQGDVNDCNVLHQEALHNREAMREWLDKNQWVARTQQACHAAEKAAIERIELFCNVLDEGPGDWFDRKKLRDFWARLADVTDNEHIANSCKNCNWVRSSRSEKKSLKFDTVTDAMPFLTSFSNWASNIAENQLSFQMDEVIQEARARLHVEGLPFLKYEDMSRSSSTPIPEDAIQKTRPAERAVPAAAASATALGIAGTTGAAGPFLTTGAAGPFLTTLGGVSILMGTAKFGERFVVDALSALRRHFEGHDVMEIQGKILRKVAEKEIKRVGNDMTNTAIAKLERAKDALRRLVEDRVQSAASELERAQSVVKCAKDAKELLVNYQV